MVGDDVTAAELATWLDASERTVRELAGREIVVRGGRGKYRLRESVAGYVGHLREVAAGRGAAAGAGGLDLVAERARLAKEQADAQAMRNDLFRGTVVLIADVAEMLGRECAIIRTRLLAIPSEAALRLHRLGTPALMQAALSDVIIEALTELSCDRDYQARASRVEDGAARGEMPE